jgi:hypothetical protein
MADCASSRWSEPGSTGAWHDPHLLRWMAAIRSLLTSPSKSAGLSGSARLVLTVGALAADADAPGMVAREAHPLINATSKSNELRKAVEDVELMWSARSIGKE